MVITKELHEFLKAILIDKKPIEIYKKFFKEWTLIDNDEFTEALLSDYQKPYELRIVPETYKAGDRFFNERNEEFLLTVESDNNSCCYIFRLISIPFGIIDGDYFTKDKDFLSMDELLQITDNKRLFKIN